MANAGELSFRDVPDCGLAIISPNDPGAMLQYAEECRTLGIPYIWDPGQQCARMTGGELKGWAYWRDSCHLQRLRVRADSSEDGLEEDAILSLSGALVVTRGEDGCSIARTPWQDGRPGRAAAPPRRSDWRRRRVPRRLPERHGARGRLPGVRADRQQWRRPTRSSTLGGRVTRTRGRSSCSVMKRTSARRRDSSKSVTVPHVCDSDCCVRRYLPSSSRTCRCTGVFTADLLWFRWEQPLHGRSAEEDAP